MQYALLKILRSNTYRISVLASILLLYLMIINEYRWLQFVAFSVIVVERAFFAFVLWMMLRVQKEVAKKLMEVMQQAQQQMPPNPFDPEAL